MKGESNPGYNELSIQKERVMDIKELVQELGNLLVLRDIAKALNSASAAGNDHAMTLLSAALLVMDPAGTYPRQLMEKFRRYGITVPNSMFSEDTQRRYDEAEASGDPEALKALAQELASAEVGRFKVHPTVQ